MSDQAEVDLVLPRAEWRDPCRLSGWAKGDEALKVEVRCVLEANFRVCGVRKVRRQSQRDGFDIARCTVSRRMRETGLERPIRGKPIRTRLSGKAALCPLDRVNRPFRAPASNRLRVSDLTCVTTWTGSVYIAFIVDPCGRRIVGWRATRTARPGFLLDALERALHEGRPVRGGGLVRHGDRGSRYVSITYTERLAEGGTEASVGKVRDSFDSAFAETIDRLYGAEGILRGGT